METRDISKSLLRLVGDICDEYDAGQFHDYWEMCLPLIENSAVRSFYVHLGEEDDDPEMVNVAFLTDSMVVDVEGGLAQEGHLSYPASDEYGQLSVTSLRSISSVEFHMGSISTLEDTFHAKLVVWIEILGSERIGRYWFAESDDEYKYLLNFGRALVEATTNI